MSLNRLTLEAMLETTILHRLAGDHGRTLPNSLRRRMERLLKADLSSIRVYEGLEASSIGALAFAHGDNLFFAPGLYRPDTVWGQHLLGHEIAHVLQQRAGVVKKAHVPALTIVQNRALEAEAERIGCLVAAAHGEDQPLSTSWMALRGRGFPQGGSVVQCSFGGILAGKTFEYFKNTVGASFPEFSKLNTSGTMYTTIDAVKEALIQLRANKPASGPTPQPVRLPTAAPTAIPDSWTVTAGPLLLYRAVDLVPGKIKNKERFSPRTNPKIALPNAIRDILADPRSYAEGHVRANYDYVHSAAMEETCAGYNTSREYVYRINLPNMTRFDPPANTSLVGRPPIIWADSALRTLQGATKLAFDPRKITKEVDLVFDIELAMIDAYKKKGDANWTLVDWDTVEKVLD